MYVYKTFYTHCIKHFILLPFIPSINILFRFTDRGVQHSIYPRAGETSCGALHGLRAQTVPFVGGIRLPGGVSYAGLDGRLRRIQPTYAAGYHHLRHYLLIVVVVIVVGGGGSSGGGGCAVDHVTGTDRPVLLRLHATPIFRLPRHAATVVITTIREMRILPGWSLLLALFFAITRGHFLR